MSDDLEHLSALQNREKVRIIFLVRRFSQTIQEIVIMGRHTKIKTLSEPDLGRFLKGSVGNAGCLLPSQSSRRLASTVTRWPISMRPSERRSSGLSGKNRSGSSVDPLAVRRRLADYTSVPGWRSVLSFDHY